MTSASGFGGSAAVAPGSWVEIYGNNLASTTRSWAAADFIDNHAPTALDGVEVTVGGQKAFVEYVSANPGQVNVQLPSTIAGGTTLPLIVKNGSGSSGVYNLPVQATAPGLLAPPAFRIGGKQYMVAQLPDGNYVLPVGAIPGVASRPARPGEVITIYGIGFGPVTPSVPAGQISTVTNEVANGMVFQFGEARVFPPFLYAGLAPGTVGLYQFNITVPLVGANDALPFSFVLANVTGSQPLYTAVSQ